MASDDVQRQVLQWDIDKAAAKRVEQATKRVYDLLERARREVNEFRSAFERHQQAMDGYNRQAKKSADETDRLKKQLLDAAGAARTMRKANEDALDRTDKKAKQAADEIRRLSQAQKEAAERARLYGDIESRTRAITGAAGFIGAEGLERQANVGAEVLASIEAIGLLKQEIPTLVDNLTSQGRVTQGLVDRVQQLVPGLESAGAKALVAGASFAAMAAATAAISVAWNAAKGIIDDSAQATRTFIDVNQRYAEIITTSTTREVLAAIEQNEKRNETLRVEKEILDEFVRQADAVDGVSGALVDLNDTLGLNLGGIEDAKDRLQEVNQEIDGNIALNIRLEQGLDANATAAADAAEHLEYLAEKQREWTAVQLADFERQTAARIQMFQRERDWSSEQVQARLEEIDVEREAIKAHQDMIWALNTLSFADKEKEVAKLEERLNSLDLESALLSEAVLPSVQERERVNAAVQGFFDAIAQGQTITAARAKLIQQEEQGLQKRLDALHEFARKSVEIEEDRERERQQEQADYERQRARDIADHYAELADLDREYYQQRGEVLEKLAQVDVGIDKERAEELKELNKDLERLAEDHHDRMIEIQRDLDLSVAQAIEDRDLKAAVQAARAAQEEARQEEQQYEKEKRRRGEDYDERLDELDEQRREKRAALRKELEDLKQHHQQRRAETIRDFNERRQREDEDRRISLQRQEQAWDIEDQRRLQHFAEAQQITSNHYATLEQIMTQGMDDIEEEFQAQIDAMLEDVQASDGLFGTLGQIGSSIGAGVGSMFGRASGGSAVGLVDVGERGRETLYLPPPGGYVAPHVGSRPGVNVSMSNQFNNISDAQMIMRVLEQQAMPRLLQSLRRYTA